MKTLGMKQKIFQNFLKISTMRFVVTSQLKSFLRILPRSMSCVRRRTSE